VPEGRPPVRRRGVHAHKTPPRRLIAAWLRRFFTRIRTLIALALLLGGAFAARGALHFLRADAQPGWSEYMPPSPHPGYADNEAATHFLTAPAADRLAQYRDLAAYFADGARNFVSADGARILYPGLPGALGARQDGFRGFARSGVVAASLVAASRDNDGALTDILRRGLIAGTDPGRPSYWGPINPGSEMVDDAADIARILYLTRAQIWTHLDPVAKTRIAVWLAPVVESQGAAVRELFAAITIERVLNALGMPSDIAASQLRFDSTKQNYVQNGWFHAGNMPPDLSSAWREDYELFWIDRIDPAFAPVFIHRVLGEASDLALHLITANGIVMFGHQLCARTALVTPVMAAHLAGVTQAPMAVAANQAVWSYFLRQGALRDGALTQGYFGVDPRLTNNETGPGSCQWGLRGLVLTMLLPDNAPYWSAAAGLLPVQQDDYRLALDDLGWVVRGQRAKGEVTLEITANHTPPAPPDAYGRWQRFIGWLCHVPDRPDNHLVKYGRQFYSATRPFAAE